MIRNRGTFFYHDLPVRKASEKLKLSGFNKKMHATYWDFETKFTKKSFIILLLIILIEKKNGDPKMTDFTQWD